jgi:hypothetical protein
VKGRSVEWITSVRSRRGGAASEVSRQPESAPSSALAAAAKLRDRIRAVSSPARRSPTLGDIISEVSSVVVARAGSLPGVSSTRTYEEKRPPSSVQKSPRYYVNRDLGRTASERRRSLRLSRRGASSAGLARRSAPSRSRGSSQGASHTTQCWARAAQPSSVSSARLGEGRKAGDAAASRSAHTSARRSDGESRTPSYLWESARRHKSTSPRCYVNLAEVLCQPRRGAMSTSPKCYVNLAEVLCQPRRGAMSTSPRCYVNCDLGVLSSELVQQLREVARSRLLAHADREQGGVGRKRVGADGGGGVQERAHACRRKCPPS